MNDDVWIRLNIGWTPAGEGGGSVGWAMWQPSYHATPWPHDELKPGFAYYACETISDGGRGITTRATVKDVLPPTEVSSAEEAHRTLAEHLFDDGFTISFEEWQEHPYNRVKADSPWPQRITAWRSMTEPVGPYVIEGLHRFPRTGWTRTAELAL